MTGSIVFSVMIIAFLAIVIFTMLQENGRRRKRTLEKIAKSWGQIPDREYTWDQLDAIADYYRNKKGEEFQVDDITWNDLDMDRIFMLMNQTVSSPGEDYLYYLLRTPLFSEEELERREQLLVYFKEKESSRRKLQEILTDIRKPPSCSVYQALHLAKDFDIGNPSKQVFLMSAFFLSLLSFIIIPQVGVFLFLLVCGINITTYLNDKEKINPNLTSFRCVMQLMLTSEKLEKLSDEELKPYTEHLKKCRKALGAFKKGAFLVVNRGGLQSGPEEIMLDYVRMMSHIDLIKFNSMMKTMKKHEREINDMLDILGYLDAMISAASFREAMPYFSCPTFLPYQKGQQTGMEVHNLYHPLITEPVANSIKDFGGILVTGSNASGKSTFLKNVALNAIMAQTIHTCTASGYQAPFYKTMTSMALRDDLQSKESYYIVEIKSLKRILDESEKEEPLLCIIDEVLRGTNTIERIAASSQILSRLRKNHVMAFTATHDIELTYILEALYTNYHFEEEVKEDDVEFNYLLKKGRVTTRNAIRLLRMVGYRSDVVKTSEEAVESFEKTGVWNKIGK